MCVVKGLTTPRLLADVAERQSPDGNKSPWGYSHISDADISASSRSSSPRGTASAEA